MLIRWLFGLPGAAIITAALFFAMAWMIRQEAPPLNPPNETELSILPKLEATEPTKQKIVRPPKIAEPEDMVIPPSARQRPPADIEIDPPTKIEKTVIDPIGYRRMQPVFKPAPQYPEACRSRGAQGVVIVEFDVTPEGDVVNPRIVSSPNPCFDRTVLRAVAGYRYPPADGDRPVMRRGVQEAFNFQLTD
jgi:protein TonB